MLLPATADGTLFLPKKPEQQLSSDGKKPGASMILFPIRSDKQKDLQERMARLGIREEDLEEHFVRSSGRGGQKVNKTSTCVALHHRPTGILVKCQESRSQTLNRFIARRRLVEQIEGQQEEQRAKENREREKIRRKKRRRSLRARRMLRVEKQKQSERKRQRRAPARELNSVRDDGGRQNPDGNL